MARFAGAGSCSNSGSGVLGELRGAWLNNSQLPQQKEAEMQLLHEAGPAQHAVMRTLRGSRMSGGHLRDGKSQRVWVQSTNRCDKNRVYENLLWLA